MELDNSESSINLDVRNFRDYMQRGDDFYKIELLRQAKSWYIKALGFNIESEKVQSRISDCDRQLNFENKVVAILVLIGTLVLAYLVLFN
jgi:hypothetical protein